MAANGRFNWSFAGVRVHADSAAAQLADEHDAKALTVGRDIYLGAAPTEETVAHELTHVAQQNADPSLFGAIQYQPKTPPPTPAGPTPLYVYKAKGIAAAKYEIDGIEFRLGVPIPDLATHEANLPSIAAEIKRANALITDSAMQVKFCVIAPSVTSRYATYKGAPALPLDTNDANVETVRHEMGHAIFAFYRAAEADPKSKFKDASTVIADIYVRLKATKAVDDDEVRTNGKKETQTHPAGLWIVDPPQWSSQPSEHPWDDPDEFFASARKAFLTDKKALEKSIAKFKKVDKDVAKPAAELLTALAALEKGKAAKLPKKVAADAKTELAALKPPTKVEDSIGTIRQGLVWALDPSQMPGGPQPTTTPSTPPSTTPAPTTP